ncbi:transmembrane protein 8B [Neocloeon triangulifer]|uniref:transmembrane protein 8B n=1 Tax=Neocloeon triangulifer TaxID=2078957 RepID=UPI00286FA0B4|nr:transmembrane protein 8B [Neocloeon triangulifer]
MMAVRDTAVTAIAAVLLLWASLGSVTRAQEIRIASQHWQGRQIREFRSYSDVEVFHFRVPDQTVTANWNFTAKELNDCEPRNVSVYVKQGSFPVVNPNNGKFPDNFRTETELAKVNGLSILSDGLQYSLSVDRPLPGDWFVIAFLTFENTKIEQKGIAKSCRSSFSTKLDITWTNETILLIPEVQNYQDIQIHQEIQQDQEINYKFFVPVDTHWVTIDINKCTSEGSTGCPIEVYRRARALPLIDGAPAFNCSENTNRCNSSFLPLEGEWHYLTITAQANTSFSLKVIFQTCAQDYPVTRYLMINDMETANICTSLNKSSKFRMIFRGPNEHFRAAPKEVCWDRKALYRKTSAASFTFEFDLLPDANGTTPLKMDVSTSRPTILSFFINPKLDIGGNTWLDVGMDPLMNTSEYNVTIVVCFSHLERYEPKFTSPKCDPDNFYLVEVNQTKKFARVVIPYPEPGTWNVAIMPFCHINETKIPCPNETLPMFFGIISSSCVYGSCGPLGRCNYVISGGLLFSTCVCSAGYKGWGCTDASEAVPYDELLLSTLLLTLSNLLFIPSIVLAIYRRFYTEALVYVCTMFFSSFYHACDGVAYSFCLLRLGVLQFCDFYSAILAFWVTLVAMSDLSPTLTSLLHMAGAITVALGIEYDRYGILVFAVPVVSGLIVLIVSWTLHCRREDGCYPSKKYWVVCLPPGLLLVAIGLVVYAFLQTEDNYKFVHSAWHAIMALSIMFLLPFRRQTAQVKLSWRGLQD